MKNYKKIVAMIAKKEAEVETINSTVKSEELRSEGLTDAAELEAILETIKTSKTNIETLRSEIDTLKEDADKAFSEELDKAMKECYRSAEFKGNEEIRMHKNDMYTQEELREMEAFKDFICEEMRDDGTTTTKTSSMVVPTKLMDILRVNLVDGVGEIYNRVKKTNVAAGLQFPLIDFLGVEAKYAGETETTKAQVLKADKKITFNAYKIEVRMAQSLFSNVMSLTEFNNLFVEQARLAIMTKLDQEILTGAGGDNAIEGIVNCEGVEVVEMNDDDFSYKGLTTALSMGKAYSKFVIITNQGTFDKRLKFVDANGRPVVVAPITENQPHKFDGHAILTVDDYCLADYDKASVGDVFMIAVDLSKYVLNSPMKVKVTRWVDHDTDEIKTKAQVFCDGKLVDPKAAKLIKKKAQ